MPWFNVDDGFANSKPLMRIPRRWRAPCIGVWTLCGSWSAKELTDGFIPNAVLDEYGATPKIVELLIDSTLWESAEGGVLFRNWSKWQRTKKQVLDYRASEADRKRNWRSSKKQTADQQEPETSATCPGGTPPGETVGLRTESALPIPKPEPSPKPSVVTRESVYPVGSAPDPTHTPSPFCDNHPGGTRVRCGDCANARTAFDALRAQQDARERQAAEAIEASRREIRELIDDCPECDDFGRRDDLTDCPNHPNLSEGRRSHA